MKRVDSTFVVITNASRTKVLLVNSKGSWGFPGGMREEWETLQEAGEREVLEETGLKVKLMYLNSLSEVRRADVHDLFATFLATVDDDVELGLTGDKSISNIDWFLIEKASELMPWYPGGVQTLVTSKATYFAS